MKTEIQHEMNENAGNSRAGCTSIRTAVFPILAGLCARPYNTAELRSELNQLLGEVRENSARAQRLIPQDIEEMSEERLDWAVTVVWLMTARETVDLPTLLRLDAIGASLNLDGCIQRLRLQVVDALQEGRPQSEDEETIASIAS